MNLYQFHSNPSKLIGYDVAFEQVPELAWDRYENNIEELKKREHLWKKIAYYSYLYTYYIIKGRWTEGEAAIATSACYSYNYALMIIEGRFLKGEATVAKDAYYSNRYDNFIK